MYEIELDLGDMNNHLALVDALCNDDGCTLTKVLVIIDGQHLNIVSELHEQAKLDLELSYVDLWINDEER